MKPTLISLTILLTSAFAQAHAQNDHLEQNLNFSASLDVTAPYNFEDDSNNRMEIRSAELTISASLDPEFDALINFAAHDENGEFHTEIHEGYISSSKLIQNLRFKAGMFLLGVGRLNQLHQHDWSFITAPKVQSEFFGDEGMHDTGLEFTYTLPADSNWDVTLGVTDGYQTPTFYLRPSTFIDLAEAGGLQIGLNYFSASDSRGIRTELSGLDLVYEKKEGDFQRWSLQSEIWNRVQNSPFTERSNQIGAYLYPEYGFSPKWFLGLRLDAFTDLSLSFDDGAHRDNLDYAFVPTLTYKNSEFVTWRIAYTHEVNNVSQEADQVNRTLELQFIALLEAH